MTTSIPAKKAPVVNGKQTHAPNQTLYCTNLPDTLQKHDLRRELYMLFATYGPVLDIVALKTMKMRGQAHIVFRDVQTSSRAMRELQGFEFLGRKMIISYAKGKSAIVSRYDGTATMSNQAAQADVSSDLQKSVFGNPSLKASGDSMSNGPSSHGNAMETTLPQGTKRRRDEESDNGAAQEEEDDDDDDAMEESDDDD